MYAKMKVAAVSLQVCLEFDGTVWKQFLYGDDFSSGTESKYFQ